MVALTEHPVVDVVLLVEDTALGSTCIQVPSTSFELGLDGINGEIYVHCLTYKDHIPEFL